MRVEAIAVGYYNYRRMRPGVDGKTGDVFVLSDPSHFSSKWMRKVDLPVTVEAMDETELGSDRQWQKPVKGKKAQKTDSQSVI